jgi:hypothetical protein
MLLQMLLLFKAAQGQKRVRAKDYRTTLDTDRHAVLQRTVAQGHFRPKDFAQFCTARVSTQIESSHRASV